MLESSPQERQSFWRFAVAKRTRQNAPTMHTPSWVQIQGPPARAGGWLCGVQDLHANLARPPTGQPLTYVSKLVLDHQPA
jgi:hypothetical protein